VQRGVEDGLDRMHAVFRLAELARMRAEEDVVGDFHGLEAELLVDLLAHGGLAVVEGGQAVHEDGVALGLFHQRGVDLVREEKADALGPQLGRLAHGQPDVGIEDVAVLRTLGGVVGELEDRAGLAGDLMALFDEPLGGHQLLRAAGAVVQTQLGADDHEGVGHIVARVAEEGQLAPLEIAELLARGQHVREHLGGVKIVGQAVPHGDAGILCQILDDRLLEAAVFDAVIEPAEHLGRVGKRLLLPHLGRARIEEGDAHAKVARGHLKGAARTGGGLLEEQDDLLVAEPFMRGAGLLHALELRREIEKIPDLLGRIVQQGKKASAADVECHVGVPPRMIKCDSSSFYSSRISGMDMQRGPPRPRESSADGISRISMPLSRRMGLVTSLRS